MREDVDCFHRLPCVASSRLSSRLVCHAGADLYTDNTTPTDDASGLKTPFVAAIAAAAAALALML